MASDSKLSLGAAGRSAALDRGKKGKKLQSGPTKHTAPLLNIINYSVTLPVTGPRHNQHNKAFIRARRRDKGRR